MVFPMLKRSIVLIGSLVLPVILVSCGSNDSVPVLMGKTQTIVVEGEKVFAEASKAEKAGKTKKAIKLYRVTATDFPFATSAAEARYREAQLLDKTGETEDAFKAYDQLLASFPNSSYYKASLDRASEIAHAVAQGKIDTRFLGIKGNISIEKTVEMLGKVRDHAPKSATAAKAQFAIAEAYLAREKYPEAVAAFRQLVNDQPNHALSPEALFRVGKIMLENADRGNQSQANLDMSREAFNDYLIQYPGHSRNGEARSMIAELDKRDLQRSFDIAEYYVKTKRDESAKVYYRDIIKHSNSGKLHDAAKARLNQIGN